MSEEPTGSIEGIITLEGTNTPIPDVEVTIHRGGSTFNATVATDVSGRFLFGNLAQGSYILHAGRDGYLEMRPALARVATGDNVRIPDLHMAPAAAIRGRILHSDGRPVAGRIVEFLELADVGGHKEWQSTRHMASTDGLGDYLNARLPAREYYIRLTVIPSGEQLPIRSDDFTIAYFPGTTDSTAALPVRVVAGEEATANFSVPTATTYKISGRVINSISNEDSLLRLGVGLVLRNSGGPLESSPTPIAQLTLPQGSTGDFEFDRIPSGEYDLFAIASTRTSDYMCNVPLEVRDQDLRGVLAVLRPGQDVKGRLVIEDGQDLGLHFAPGAPEELPPLDPDRTLIVMTSSSRDRDAIRINLERADGLPEGRYRYGPLVSETGASFTFPNVPQGSYRISATGFPLMPLNGKTYLADIRIGGRSILENNIFEIENGPVDPIEVIVGANGGSVQGTIPDKGNETVQLLRIPEPHLRSNASLFVLITLSEAQRQFNFRGMAPGNYKLLALRTPERQIPIQSKEFLEKYEPLATAISIQKGVRLDGLELSLATYR